MLDDNLPKSPPAAGGVEGRAQDRQRSDAEGRTSTELDSVLHPESERRCSRKARVSARLLDGTKTKG